jgi:hypothetical protein
MVVEGAGETSASAAAKVIQKVDGRDQSGSAERFLRT